MATQEQLPAGPAYCCPVSATMKFFTEGGGEPTKLIVSVKVANGTEPIDHSEFMTIDARAMTSGGKQRVLFTIGALRALGATRPELDMAEALDAGKQEVTFAGIDIAKWIPCDVKHAGQYVNVGIYESRELDAGKAKKAGAELRALVKDAGPSKPAVNPFGGRPPAPIAPPGADTGFPFGANQDTP